LEAEAELYYYQARWYDPGLGRFAQADSIVPVATQGVLAWDRYAYVNNNPVNGVDSTGHCIDGISTYICIVLAGAAIGAVVSYGAQVAGNIAENGWSGEAFTDVDGASIAAAAVAGAVGAGVGIAGAAIAGTGLVATMATGAVAGVASGQASRATGNVLAGQDIGSGLGNPADMLIDGMVGGALSGAGYGAGNILQSKFYTGDLPTSSSSRYLLRKQSASFVNYDPKTGRANYRVDLEGRVHMEDIQLLIPRQHHPVYQILSRQKMANSSQFPEVQLDQFQLIMGPVSDILEEVVMG
jgi:RHS repeat-associated protein